MHLTDRILRDYYIYPLIEKKFIVEFWDIVPLVFDDNIDAGMKTEAFLYTFRTYNQLEMQLNLHENKQACFVMLISYGKRFSKIYKLLTKYNCKMLYFEVGATPCLEKPKQQKILNHLFHPLRLTKIVYEKIMVKIYRRFRLIKPFDIVFAAGSFMQSYDKYSTKRIPINLSDYDHFIKVNKETNRIVKGKYAVYLDVFLANHNDLDIQCLPSLNSNNYYLSMNRFFDLLEKEYSIKIVIAAHPTAEYDFKTFNGREIYRLRTAELVKDAEFVISMHSTSTSYAILNLKPIVFIYTNDMNSLYSESIMRNIQAFSNYLESPLYNIDEIKEGRQVFINEININRYQKYKYEFLTSHESENNTTQEIFLREISKYI